MYKKTRNAWNKQRRDKKRWADLRKRERVVRQARMDQARTEREKKTADREKKAAARAAARAAAAEAPPPPPALQPGQFVSTLPSGAAPAEGQAQGAPA
ncbi:MAG TPA: hypothetical protein VFI25_01055 [Planctomycetota bacterium]|jgi:hypothetical protein|nr:hypothetical protein [Planctomycetota bacterium]